MCLTCPCKSVLRSIKAHVRANTAPEDIKKQSVNATREDSLQDLWAWVKHYKVNSDSPEEEKASGLHWWKRRAKCCSTRSLSWLSPISTTTFRKDLRARDVERRQTFYKVFYELFCFCKSVVITQNPSSVSPQGVIQSLTSKVKELEVFLSDSMTEVITTQRQKERKIRVIRIEISLSNIFIWSSAEASERENQVSQYL